MTTRRRPERAEPERTTLWRDVMRREWTDEQREEFEERAAIVQFDGGLTREEAEKAAFRMVAGRKVDGKR